MCPLYLARVVCSTAMTNSTKHDIGDAPTHETYAALSLLIIPVTRAPITEARRIPPRIAYTIVPVIIGPGTLMFDILFGLCTTGSCLLFALLR